jgi:hypothetical protein
MQCTGQHSWRIFNHFFSAIFQSFCLYLFHKKDFFVYLVLNFLSVNQCCGAAWKPLIISENGCLRRRVIRRMVVRRMVVRRLVVQRMVIQRMVIQRMVIQRMDDVPSPYIVA